MRTSAHRFWREGTITTLIWVLPSLLTSLSCVNVASAESPPYAAEQHLFWFDAPPLHEAAPPMARGDRSSGILPELTARATSHDSAEGPQTRGTSSDKGDTHQANSETEGVSASTERLLEVQIIPPHPRARDPRGPLVIRWSAPMIPLTEVGSEPTIDVQISPKIRGEWSWDSDQNITFTPTESWPHASLFTTRVLGPTQSLNGDKLGSYFQLSRTFTTSRNEVDDIRLCGLKDCHKYKYWGGPSLISKSARVAVCFEQALPRDVPLQLFRLSRIDRETELEPIKLSFDAEVRADAEARDRCVYLRIEEEIPPFSDFKLTVSRGAPSASGPLLSTSTYSRRFESERRLKVYRVGLGRDHLTLRFNQPVSPRDVRPYIALLPMGVDPNMLSDDERIRHDLLSPLAESDEPTPLSGRISLPHRVPLQDQVGFWMRTDGVRTNDYNILQRSDLFKLRGEHWTNGVKLTPDRGERWVYITPFQVDLGRAYAETAPRYLSAEPINLPATSLRYYGVDELCLRWQSLTTDQLAGHDAMRITQLKLPLPLAAQDYCIDVADPTYLHRRAHVPLAPYRFALRGPESSWSLLESYQATAGSAESIQGGSAHTKRDQRAAPRHQSQESRGQTHIQRDSSSAPSQEVARPESRTPVEPHRVSPRPPALKALPSVVRCADQHQPCQRRVPLQSSVGAWLKQTPTIQSGSGPHLYLYTQRWRWNPKRGRISGASMSRGSGGGERYSSYRSLLQITRLGVIGKFSRTRGEVWVWDLLSRDQVRGAQVKLYKAGGDVIAQAETDEYGVARLEIPISAQAKVGESQHYYVIAEYLGDVAFISTYSDHQVYSAASLINMDLFHKVRHEYFTRGDDQREHITSWDTHSFTSSTRGALWLSRGIYRPSESMEFGGALMVAGAQGDEPLDEVPCEVSLSDHRGKELEKMTRTTSPLGGISGVFKLPKNAALGEYTIEAKCAYQGEVRQWSTTTRVAHFRTPRFALDAKVDKRTLITGDQARFTLAARYLYGAPMQNKYWSAHWTNEQTQFSPRGEFPRETKETAHQTERGDSLESSQRTFRLSDFGYGDRGVNTWSFEELISDLSRRYPHLSSVGPSVDEEGDDDSRLNFKGRASLKSAFTLKGIKPYTAQLTWTVTDSDGQSQSVSDRVIVHPTQGYVGLRSPQGDYLSTKEAHEVEVIWVDALSQEPEEGHPVQVELFMKQWSDVSLKDEVGRDSIESQQDLSPIGGCRVTTRRSPVRCQVKVPRGGELVWVATSSDARGVKTSTILTTYGYESDATWERREGNQLKVHIVDREVKPGEQLRVLIENPLSHAEAWVTVERERILYSKRMHLKSAEMIEIPVTEEMFPNATVKVVLTRPRISLPYRGAARPPQAWFPPHLIVEDEWSETLARYADLGRPLELYGYGDFSVKLARRELSVSVTPDADEKRPGEEISVKVRVRDHSGRPVSGEVFIWAVDEGVARLTDYQPPNILEELHQARTHQVETFSHLGQLEAHISLGDKGRPVIGDGAASMGAKLSERDTFNPTPFFVGNVKVNDQGEAILSHKLSDDLTTFKLYAVALSLENLNAADERPYQLLRAGVGSSEVKVNRPLMVRPALPRTFTVGDRVFMGAMINSLLLEDRQVSVRYEVSGGARPLGDQEIKTAVKALGDRLVRLPYEVHRLQPVRVKLSLFSGGELVDVVSVTLPVNPPALPERYAKRGALVGAESPQVSRLKIGLKRDEASTQVPAHKSVTSKQSVSLPSVSLPSELQVELGGSLMTTMFSELRGLLSYPYGCLEQRSSKVLPFALLSDFGDRFKARLAKWSTSRESKPLSTREVIRRYLQKISEMQLNHGGLSYWLGSKREYLWASSYAYIVLKEIERAGYSIAPVDLGRLEEHLSKVTLSSARPHSHRESTTKVTVNEAVMIAFAFSEYGQPLTGLEGQLLARRSTLSTSSLLWLASALGGSLDRPSRGARRALAQSVLRDVMSRFSFDGDQLRVQEMIGDSYHLDSEPRTIALAIRALLRVTPEDPRVMNLLQSLFIHPHQSVELNTQESAFMLLALRDYLRVHERVDPKLSVAATIVRETLDSANRRDAKARETSDPKSDPERDPDNTSSVDKRGGGSMTLDSSKQLLIEREITSYRAPPVSVSRKVYLAGEAPKKVSALPQQDQPLRGVESLEISASGEGRLYYSTQLTHYPKTARERPVDRGYTLQRSYHLLTPAHATEEELRARFDQLRQERDASDEFVGEEGEPELPQEGSGAREDDRGSHSFQVGDLIEVRLKLSVRREARYLVVNDPLPAGVEIVDPSLRGAATGRRLPSYLRDPWRVFDHVELRRDRVLLFADHLKGGAYRFTYLARVTSPGRFVRPAALVEEMYRPERSGLSDGGLFWVRP